MGKRSAPRVREQDKFETSDPLNGGRELTVVQLSDGRYGILDNDTFGVWIEHALNYELVPGWRKFRRITIPPFPKHYGRWEMKAIGGLSKTARRLGCIRAKATLTEPVTLFALRMPEQNTAEEALQGLEDVATLGDTECCEDQTCGNMCELIVHEAKDADFVAARLARAGVPSIIFEDTAHHALQPIGVERLDRIESKVCKTDDDDEREYVDEFGLGRGGENWMFEWIPQHWRFVPVTWDYMVLNVDGECVHTMPPILRQHVAKYRYNNIEDKQSPEALELRRYLFDANGAPKRRLVSCGLSIAQAQQACRCFYALSVERVECMEVRHAASLVLYHLMIRQGYTARYMGKYLQNAFFIGNGIETRKFERLPQYHPHRLPAHVINKLMDKKGKIQGRGNKGSRSKYVSKDDRYRPKSRVARSNRLIY